MVGMMCSVKGCGSKYNWKNGQESGKNFFSMPKDKEVWTKWLPAIGREDLTEKMLAGTVTQRVCSDHFAEDCFLYVRNLKKDAIPTLKLPTSTPGSYVFPEEEEEIDTNTLNTSNTNVSTQTEDYQSTEIENNVDRKYDDDDDKLIINLPDEHSNSSEPGITLGSKRKRVSKDISPDDLPCRKIKTEDEFYDHDDNDHEAKDKFLENCDEYLDERLSEIVKCHASLLNKLKTKTRDTKFKMFALKLYLSSPVSYRILLPFFNLPAIKTLHLTKIPIWSGIKENTDLQDALRSKISVMTSQQRVCCICIDSTQLIRNLNYDMAHDKMLGLREIDGKAFPVPANHAVVLMARGILENWTQPIAYAMIVERKHYIELSQWVEHALSELLEMGLDIRALVVDLDMDFTFGRNWKKINYKKTFIEIGGKKIYYVFDPISIIVSARNCLKKNDVHFSKKNTVASWKHIEQVYEVDIREENRLVPKLTYEHTKQEVLSKQHANLCREIFTRSLASGMYFYAKARHIDEDVESTVDFIKKISDALSILYPEIANSQYDSNGMYRGNAEQKTCFVECLNLLKSIVMVTDKLKRVYRYGKSSVPSLVVTIESTMNLFYDLHEEFGAAYILSRNLSLNCLDKYFSESIKQASDGLTPTIFVERFRKSYISSLLTNTKILKNRLGEDDLSTCILEIQDFLENLNIPNEDTSDQSLQIKLKDFDSDSTTVKTDLFFTAYLVTKCIEKHECKEFREYLNQANNCENVNLRGFHRFYEQYSSRSQKASVADLYLPPKDLMAFVCGVTKMMNQVFQKKSEVVMQPLAKNLLALIKTEVPLKILPCPCFPIEYFMKLCVQKKIHEIVRANNIKYNNGFRTPNTVEVQKFYHTSEHLNITTPTLY